MRGGGGRGRGCVRGGGCVRGEGERVCEGGRGEGEGV